MLHLAAASAWAALWAVFLLLAALRSVELVRMAVLSQPLDSHGTVGGHGVHTSGAQAAEYPEYRGGAQAAEYQGGVGPGRHNTFGGQGVHTGEAQAAEHRGGVGAQGAEYRGGQPGEPGSSELFGAAEADTWWRVAPLRLRDAETAAGHTPFRVQVPYMLPLTRYCFTSKLYCRSQSSFHSSSPTCKAYPIAILLHAHCAIYALPPTPRLYAIPYTVGDGNIV